MISNASQIYYYIYEPSQGLTFMVMYIYIYTILKVFYMWFVI